MTPGLRQWGRADAPRVLLLHCALAHSGAWDRVAKRLADRYHLLAPDLVGHARGPKGDPDRDYHDQTTEQALRLLGDEPAHLVGHSFGGTVALRVAEDAPDRVRSLTMFEPVLFAAAPDSAAKRENAERLAALRPMVERGETRQAAALFLSVWGTGEPFEALSEAQARAMADTIWVIPAQQPSLHEDSAGLLPRLGDVTCPTLLMRGGASPAIIHDIVEALAAGLPDARRSVIHGGGHMSPVTHADLVAAELSDFLDRLA